MRVLFVDDEGSIRRLAERVLGRSHEVLLAASLGEAREVLSKTDSVHLALVDQGLPDGDGMDLLHQLRSEREHTFRVVMSGHPKAVGDPAYHLPLNKPFGLRELRAIVAKAQDFMDAQDEGITDADTVDHETPTDPGGGFSF